MTSNPDVLVVDGSVGDTVSDEARDLLIIGRRLADQTGGQLAFLGFGPDDSSSLSLPGVDIACRTDARAGGGYQGNIFADVIIQAARALQSCTVLLPHAPSGIDLAPRVAFSIAAVCATGCTNLEFADSELRWDRSAYGGKVTLLEGTRGTAVLTVRDTAKEPPRESAGAASRTLELSTPPQAKVEDIAFVARERSKQDGGARLKTAKVIVSGGQGLGSREAFTQLQVLADALGGVVAGSKFAVDRGWLPSDRQVGMSGQTVAPQLYLAIGISGATHHFAGCRKSKLIVAINNDPDAPIFQFAHYGLVRTWEEIVPELIAQVAKA